MIKISSNSKIYIAVQANVVAGGSESLHQLCSNLVDLGYDAYMYYKPTNINDPIPAEYKKYNIKIARRIKDSPQNVFIVAEIWTFLLYRFSRVQKVIFWLSIDNYYNWLEVRDSSWIKRWLKSMLGYNKFFIIKDKSTHPKNLFHIAQSKYAIEHLRERGIDNVDYVPDYIHDDFTSSRLYFTSLNRQNIVAYNPAKGLEFTKRLISIMNDVQWFPLNNLTPIQMKEKLSICKVYVDFGNHPGKDRIPREAALLGCCVITNKIGSAAYEEDVKLPEVYKFDEVDINEIVITIYKCINDYDNVIKEFDNYRRFVATHHDILKQRIGEVFSRIKN